MMRPPEMPDMHVLVLVTIFLDGGYREVVGVGQLATLEPAHRNFEVIHLPT